MVLLHSWTKKTQSTQPIDGRSEMALVTVLCSLLITTPKWSYEYVVLTLIRTYYHLGSGPRINRTSMTLNGSKILGKDELIDLT